MYSAHIFDGSGFANNAEASRLLAEGVRSAFEEDCAILNAVQLGFTQTRTAGIDIAIDAAPLRFRRRLRQLIAAQAERKSSTTTSTTLELPSSS